MRKYKYYCLNDDCEEDFIIIEKPESEKDKKEYCPTCGSELKLMGEFAYSVGKYRMMTSQERKESLLKRSKDHYNKKLKEKKEEMLKNPFASTGKKR